MFSIKDLKFLPKTSKEDVTISIFNRSDEEKHIIITLDSAIGDSHNYATMCHFLRTVRQQDEVTINLNTPGGNVFACMDIIAAMKACKSDRLNTHVLGIAYSCGAYIWSYGKNRTMGKHARLMFHTSSGMVAGRNRNMIDSLEGVEQTIVSMLSEVEDRGILTSAEVEKIVDKRADLYFDYESMKGRTS